MPHSQGRPTLGSQKGGTGAVRDLLMGFRLLWQNFKAVIKVGFYVIAAGCSWLCLKVCL